MSTNRRRRVCIGAIVVIVAFGIAGCGGSSSAGRSSASSSAGLAAPLRLFRVVLKGTAERPAHGAGTGSGLAIVAIHRGSMVCWRFAHLHGFVNATVARIHVGSKSKSGRIFVPLSTGPRLHHRGCVQANAATVGAIQRHPSSYYLNVASLHYPDGAVRGQL